MNNIFIKQTHTDFRMLVGLVYLICLILVTLVSIRNQYIHFMSILFLIVLLDLCWYISKFLNGFGLYIQDSDIYYKKIKKHSIDIKSVCGIKIVKSEIDGKYGRRPIKDIHGNNMYSMVFLSEIIDEMYNYQQGDTMFIHEFKKYVLFSTIYSEDALKYMKTCNGEIIIF